ncbi:MAG: hypothetical protein ACO1N9_02480 [Flavobacterium sp.]|uniref:hypothetical protein n=1 Tax=Flavobacterium sp. J372 TaxID=2898436 RepID=UPI0021513C64|nr:hypothetical protein [Flavobacterium sp. J372]MCR5862578.1 hypothetical protein [Flavobacterium sp. J372]MDC7217467.1 hypothetical protein [Spirochaetales bacterium]
MKALYIILLAGTFSCYSQNKTVMATDNHSSCSPGCEAKSRDTQLSCKLTSPELQTRKATIIASLKSKIKERKELSNGFAYRFDGSDAVVDELADFIKTERECCGFFTFTVSVSGDKSEAWMELKGPDGAKEFIKAELDL